MSSSRLEELGLRRRGRLRRLKDVPVLPSLITLGNLCCGFLAIAKVADALRAAQPGAEFATVLAFFEAAVVLVFVAMVFDALDGRVARMTGQTTPFGAQLDSMADMVTFGCAPAFLCKVLVDWHAQIDGNRLLPLHPRLFFAAASVYVVGAALRLARFNVETGADEDDHREFKGLPSPAAASIACALVALFCTRNDASATLSHLLLAPRDFDLIVVFMPGVLVLLGLLMVSRLPYPHAMHWLMKGRNSLPVLAVAVAVVIVAAIEWQLAVAATTLAYLFTGPAIGVFRLALRRRQDDDDGDGDEPRPQPSHN
jgi:CDP-diacylglycerol--serine O-phosphatidyltransferase